MKSSTRRRLWIIAAYASGVLAMMVALDGDALKNLTPYLKFALLSLCIVSLAVCLRAIHRIDFGSANDPRKPLRAALANNELRGTSSLSLAVAVGMPIMAALMGAIAYDRWHAADYLTSVFMGVAAVTLGTGWIWLLRHRMQPRELRIDAAGIHSPDLGLIAWDDVVGIRRYYGRQFNSDFEALQLCLRHHRRYLDRLPAWQRVLRGARTSSYAPILLMVSPYEIPIETAYLSALTLRRRIAAAFVEDWEPAMSDAEIDSYLAARPPVPAPGATFGQRLQAQQSAGEALSRSRAHQLIRNRARKRRWHEGAWRRAIVGLLAVAAYVLVMGGFDGLFD